MHRITIWYLPPAPFPPRDFPCANSNIPRRVLTCVGAHNPTCPALHSERRCLVAEQTFAVGSLNRRRGMRPSIATEAPAGWDTGTTSACLSSADVVHDYREHTSVTALSMRLLIEMQLIRKPGGSCYASCCLTVLD